MGRRKPKKSYVVFDKWLGPIMLLPFLLGLIMAILAVSVSIWGGPCGIPGGQSRPTVSAPAEPTAPEEATTTRPANR